MNKITIIITMIALMAHTGSYAQKNEAGPELQRIAKGVIDLQENTESEFEFILTNNGILGLDMEKAKGSGIWPRGSQNQYLFGSGFWFGAKKQDPNAGPGELRKYAVISYDPNNGRSWFVPGSISDGPKIDEGNILKNRVYFSTDFNTGTGEPLNNEDGPSWPLWINGEMGEYQYGAPMHVYENDITNRNSDSYQKGPMFLSGEDIFSIFKDTDLDYYDGGAEYRGHLGYPLGLECQKRIYTWGEGDMADVVIISYVIQNKSKDTLHDCWFAGVYDIDIALAANASQGAVNDRIKYFDNKEDLNLAVGWSDTDKGEEGKGFGYIGISFLESPAVGGNGFIRNDKNIFSPDEQLGMKTFHNWNISQDVFEDGQKYDFMSTGSREGDNGPGDKRMLLATGLFNMKPGDKARVAVSITFALPAVRDEPDGSYEDITGFKKGIVKKNTPDIQEYNSSLVGKLTRATDLYYNQAAVSVENEEEFSISRLNAFPNPADNGARVSFYIEKAGKVRISLASLTGAESALIAEKDYSPGNYTEYFEIDKERIAPGVYFLKLETGGGVLTRKLVIMP